MRESKDLGVWRWDLKTLSIDVNPLKVEALGYNASEVPYPITHEFFTEKIYVEDHPQVRDAMLSILKGEADDYLVSYRIRTKTGGVRIYKETCQVVEWDELKKPVLGIGRTFDITESGFSTDLTNTMDPLTNVLTRVAILEYLSQCFEIASKQATFLTVAIFKIEEFMTINDREGRFSADYMLIRVADLIGDYLDKHLRVECKVGRYAVDQFLVVFSDVPNVLAYDHCKKIKAAIDTHNFGFEQMKQTENSTVSFALKEYLGESMEALIKSCLDKL